MGSVELRCILWHRIRNYMKIHTVALTYLSRDIIRFEHIDF